MRLLVVGVSNVRGYVGMSTEECHVELLDGHARIAHTLEPTARQVQVEVAAKHPEGFRMHRVEVGQLVRAPANPAVAHTKHHRAIPAVGPAKRTHRIAHHLTGIRAGVMRKSLADRPVG